MTTIDLTLPQWSVGTEVNTLLTLAGSRVWTNITVITKDQYYGSLFSNTSNVLYLLSGQVNTSTPGSIFTLRDSRGGQYPLKLIVNPPTYSVSSNITLYQYDSTIGFPITYTSPTVSSGQISIPRKFSTLTVAGVTNTFVRNNAVRFANYNFSPVLPIGITSSMDGFGVVTLSGPATVIRAPAVYNMYTRTGINQTVVTSTTIQVLPARFQFSNVLGYDASFSAILGYKVSNDVRFACKPAPTSLRATNTISGMNFTIVGSNVVFSGTPSSFLDIPEFTVVNVIGPNYTTPITLKFTMNPCLELIYEPTYDIFARYSYTQASPYFSVRGVGHPASTSQVAFTLTQGIPGLQVATNGDFYGAVPTTSAGNQIIVSATDPIYSTTNRATFTLNVCRDVITVSATLLGVPITQLTCSENVEYFVQTSASALSKRPIISYSVESSALFPGTLDISKTTGLLRIIPHDCPQGTTPFIFNICAYTEVYECNLAVRANIVSDTLRFDVSRLAVFSNAAKPFTVVQGRPVDQLDYDDYIINFTASATSTREVRKFWLSPEFENSGLTVDSNTGTISGTPLFSGILSGIITAGTIDHVLASLPFYIYAIPDQLIITSPATTDFITSLGNVKTIQLKAYSFSVSPIVSYSLSGQPNGVLITNDGIITLTGQMYQSTTPFAITALTHDGITLTYPASLTVNNQNVGQFLSPLGSDLLFIPVGASYPIVTTPSGLTITQNGSTALDVIGSNLVHTSTTSIYPPALISLTASTNMTIPVRVTDKYLQPFIIGQPSTHWVQYVPIYPITISASRITTPVVFTIPNVPRGTRWNPITSTLKGFPYDLTIESSFAAYACDGNTVQPLVINYSSRTPAYLRPFSAPSSYTNYVKQRAFINSAVHAIDRFAILPDQILASETAPYPIDVCTSVICGKCKVDVYTPTVADISGWAPFRETDWFITSTSVKYIGMNNAPPYTFLHTTHDYAVWFIQFNAPRVNRGTVDVGVSPLNENANLTYGFRFDSSGNVSFISQAGSVIRTMSPATLSYSSAEDFALTHYYGLVYYLIQGKAVANTSVSWPYPSAIATRMSQSNDMISNVTYGYGMLDISAGSNWYARDGRSWTIGSNNVTYLPSSIPLFTSTIVKNISFRDSYFKFVVQSNVLGTAGFANKIQATTVNYGFLMAVGSAYGFLGQNITAYTATQTLNVGSELAIVTRGCNAYFLQDGLVVGIGPYVDQTNFPLVQLTQSGGSLSNIGYGNGVGGYSLTYNYLNAPSSSWITTNSPYNTITHIASSTDTVYSFVSGSNVYITGQPKVTSGRTSIGLSNSTGATFQIAFNYPIPGQYSAYVNTTPFVVGTFSSNSYYAVSISGSTVTYTKDGTPFRTTGGISGTSRAFVTSDANGDSFIPLSVGNDLFLNISSSGSGNLRIANNYIERTDPIEVPDFVVIPCPYVNCRLDVLLTIDGQSAQIFLASTAVGETLFDFNIYTSYGNLIVNRMTQAGGFQVMYTTPYTTNDVPIGMQVVGTTITVFIRDVAVATFPTKFGRTGLTAPWRFVVYGSSGDTVIAKNIVLSPL